MALIGTISGSNGTTTSAVTGSLIIAADPSTITPVKPTDVVLFVSGAATSIGAELPSILFKGDSFVSGAFGTDSYIQMKPVNTLRIPTNQTASYIYTSGSTNDLYFTQYSEPYTNTTRLRWIEGVLTTGLLHGGIVSTVNGTTTFSVTAGSGLIVTPNATTSSDPYPTLKLVEWPAFTSSSLEYSGSAQVSYITINASSELVQLNTPPTLAQFKDRIVLGRVLHQTGSVTNGAVNAPAMSFSAAANIFDFVRPFGPLKVSGHTLAASGSTLGLTKTAGDSFAEGRNYSFDPSNPNTILSTDDPALVNCKIYYQYVSGSTTITNTGVANAGFAVIDPAQYNNNGTLAAVANSEWTNQRVYWFPRSVNRALFVYYGVTKYATLDDAVASINSEAFVEGSNTKDSAIFVGVVSVRGNETNLSDTVTSRISQAGLFRASFGGGGGGGTTPPAGSTTQVQFNDAGAFGGSANFTFNNITNALTVVGDITGSNLRLTGDAAVVGGDLTTTATTFNLANATATTVNLGGGASAVNIGAAGSATTFAGNITGSRVTSNAAGSLAIGGGQIYLNGASSNRIDFSSQGTGDPAFNAPTAGTKVVLYPAAGASATDYALGISPATLWQSIPSTDAAMMFKWFGGTTTLAALSGSGNMEISGDLAVNGGDITSTAASLNISAGASGIAFQSGNSSFVTFVSGVSGPFQQVTLQASSGKSLLLAAGSGATPQVIISGSLVEIRSGRSGPGGVDFSNDVGGLAQSYLNIISGSYVAGGVTVTNAAKIVPGDAPQPHDLLVGASATRSLYLSGSSVVANMGNSGFSFQRDGSSYGVIQGVSGSSFTIGSAAGVISMNLVSSGNVTVRLDSDNNATGHQFQVQDYRGINQFFVGEDGNAELSGSLVVTSSLAVNGGNITSTATSVNIVNTTPTTVTIANNASNLYLGKSGVNRVVIQGNLLLNGNEIQASGGATALTFPSGNSSALFAANVTVTGDVAVNGGDLTTTSTSFNLLNGTATTVAFGGAATSMKIASGSGTAVEIGASTGRTTVYNDLAIVTGNIIGAPGAGANVMTLISSGNIIAKLDIDKSADGHKFIVQDGNGIEQFSVGENGNAEISGSLVVTGSTNIGVVVENLINSNGGTGVVAFDTSKQGIFYVNGPTGGITANFTNVPTTNLRVLTPTVILSQSATPQSIAAVQIDGAAQTLNWANSTTPTVTANKQDVFGFSLIRSGSAWKVLGQLSTYG